MEKIKQKVGQICRGLRRSPSRSLAEGTAASTPTLTSSEDQDRNQARRPVSTGGYAVSASSVSPSTNHTSSTSQISPIVGDTEPSLWRRAWDGLSESDKKDFHRPPIDTSERDYTGKLLEDIKKHRNICLENRWKFTFRNKDIVVRDVVDKLFRWIEKFKEIGDIIVQFDQVHAALPWAGVRFLLQLSLSDREAMGVIIIGMERIVKLLVRSVVYEELYLNSKPKISVRAGLEEALVGLYSAVLEFLVCAKQHFTNNKATRIIRTLLDSEGAKSLYDMIEERESLLEKELTTAERELQTHHRRMLEEKLKGFLEEIEKPITRIDSNVALMYDEFQSDEKRSKILGWLSNVEYIKHHQKASEDLLENTGIWLLNKKQFREWRSSSASGILWLCGIPGAGKTKLTCMVINFLKSVSQTQGPVVYFYFNRNEPQRQDPEVLMRAIVKQLSVVLPSGLPKPVVAEYNKREKAGLAAGSLGFQESQNLIVSLLDKYPQTTIIIDALDESDPGERWRLLKALKAIIDSSASLVKIFISSRNDTNIKLELEHLPNINIEAKDNGGDIERFVFREVSNSIGNKRLLHGLVPDELKEKIISTVVEKANGMFQWADLQIKYLCKLKLQKDVEENLGKLPDTLEETYSQIWNDVLLGTPRAQELTKKALMWVMCSQRQLNREVWAEASFWPEKVSEGDIDILFDLCRNLVVWDKQLECVIFVHLSVQEYLESRCFNSVDANSMAAESCLSLLKDPDLWPEVEIPYQFRSFPEYSALYWAGHVERSYSCEQRVSKHMLDTVQQFLWESGKPSRAYCKWTRLAPRKDGSLRHLQSIPPNPYLAMSYFDFGEELKMHWEYDSFDIESSNSRGETLLFLASMRGNEGVMNLLLGKGADINACNCDGVSPLMAAITNGQGGAVVKLVDKGADVGAGDRNILKAAAERGDAAVMTMLLARDGNVEITEAVLAAAVANWHSSKEIIGVLLARDGNIEITEAVLSAAAANQSDKEIMKILLARDGNIEITEAVLTAAAANPYKGEDIMKMLLARDGNIEITKAVLTAAAANWYSGKGIMEMLLARDGNIKITEAVLTMIIGQGDIAVMEKLLARGGNIEITEAVLSAAAANHSDKEIMKILLARDGNIEITEAVLTAAAANPYKGEEIMEMLLARDGNIEITEAVPMAAVANWNNGKKIMEMLLARDGNIEITEAVLTAAAAHWNSGKEITKMLLARYGNIEITEAVLTVVIGQGDIVVMEKLLARGGNIEITEAVLTAAVANWNSGKKIMEMLLARDGNIEITEAVLSAAAADPCKGEEIMKMLLAGDGNIEITGAVLTAAEAYRNSGEEVMKILLARDGNIEITEAVLSAAANHRGKEIMKILLARDGNIKITEAVLTAAVANPNSGEEIMKMLLARDGNIEITEAVLTAAAANLYEGEEVMNMLLARNGNIEITEAVLTTAAANWNSGEEILKMLLARDGNIEITEAVLTAAAANWRSGEEIMKMLRGHIVLSK